MTMSRLSICRAAGLGFGLGFTALVPAWASDGGLSETCRAEAASSAGTSPELAPLKSLDLIYITTNFKKPGLVEEAPDEHWSAWKLDQIEPLAQERAPKVLKANGLEGQVTVLPAPAPGSAVDLGTLDPARPALLLRPIKYAKWQQKPLYPKAGSVTYAVELINGGPDRPALPCRVEVWGGVGVDSKWGILKTNRVDAEWVDGMLTNVLASLSRKGVIKLANDKAVRPAE
ncbi:hypothetical protein [Pelomonas sp. KK5]|uniref:hypothetical protein n=1 Tax=Pelomonas sp. KK5 TaxID=1855730 RepID=UPI0011811496|nr:hypothetical protein [Pelomonas sp. KK5]